MSDTKKVLDELTRRLTDDGKLIECGWISMQMLVLPADAPAVQVQEMRKAFFMGAYHLFTSIMTILEPGEEPTDKDLDRMSVINTELEAFRMEVTSVHTAGRG